MNKLELQSDSLPGLYQAADRASIEHQSSYFFWLRTYLLLLVAAAFVSFQWGDEVIGAVSSAVLFLLTLGILVYLNYGHPAENWYHGRAVAESVKTRAWRWCMRAEPYDSEGSHEIVSKEFVNDLRSILTQNRSLAKVISGGSDVQDPISETMIKIRGLSFEDRFEIYKSQRIDDQRVWYSKKSQFNKRRSSQLFAIAIGLHLLAIILLVVRATDVTLNLPIEVVATAAGSCITWLQAKRHSELSASYGLAAHEIGLIKGEALSIKNESQLSDFVINSEAAFSREHTQWVARKTE